MDTPDVDELFSSENKQLRKLHEIVKQTIKEEELIINNLLHPPEEVLSRGQKVSDRVARFGGAGYSSSSLLPFLLSGYLLMYLFL